MDKKEDNFILIFVIFMQLMLIILAASLAETPDKKDESLNEIMQRLENTNVKSLENKNIKIEIYKKETK